MRLTAYQELEEWEMFGSTDHSKQVVVREQRERKTPRPRRTARNRQTGELKEPREPGNCNSQRTTRTREPEDHGNWEIIYIYIFLLWCKCDVSREVFTPRWSNNSPVIASKQRFRWQKLGPSLHGINGPQRAETLWQVLYNNRSFVR